jgi:hypothetical protein
MLQVLRLLKVPKPAALSFFHVPQCLHVYLLCLSSQFPLPSVFLCLVACLCLSVYLSPHVSVSVSFVFNNYNNEKSSFPTLLGRETKGGEPRDEGEG